MRLISSPESWINGYSPFIDGYTKIYYDLVSGTGGIDVSAIISTKFEAQSISCNQFELLSTSVTGTGPSNSVSGYYNAYPSLYKEMSGVSQNGNSSLGYHDPTTMSGAFMIFDYDYYILDSASAAISSYCAQNSDSSGKTFYPGVIRSYPSGNYFTVSATITNLDTNNIPSPDSILVVRPGSFAGTPYLYYMTRSATASNEYFGTINLNQEPYLSNTDFYGSIEAREGGGSKTTYGATGSFVLDTSLDNSASGSVFGGTRGTESVSGHYNSVGKSIGSGTAGDGVTFNGYGY